MIWDPRELPVCSEWQVDGPLLPVEFARQSADDRITLVITPNVRSVPVLWAEIDVDCVHSARSALAEREGISGKFLERSVGFWRRDGETSKHEHAELIGDWALSKEIDGLVWTELKPKIGNSYRTPSTNEVISHLTCLEGLSRSNAKEYILNAPAQIETVNRSAIREQLGWN
ncbi:hypothetical protein [Ruegeria sp. HKCCD6157]|uniref:hypothetical protein n=1 Tax=Ruegeria sp. HKCCD6157 TaxID=2690707 RepID=UPI001491CC2D|nr:hypothetical protein [Ruegeria sp. HKCCD6157]NOE24830.1 hypothetical protein [Ruegeria sp. HKCCD6157]